MLRSLVGSEMCIRDSINAEYGEIFKATMDRVRARTQQLHNSLSCENRTLEAKNALPPAGSVLTKQRRAELLEDSMNQLQSMKKGTMRATVTSPGYVTSPGSKDIAKAAAKIKGLEKQYRKTQVEYNRWKQTMGELVVPRPTELSVEPYHTPMKQAFRTMSDRMNQVTGRLCSEPGLNCYPLEIEEGMKQVQKHLSYTRCVGAMANVRGKVHDAQKTLAANAEVGGASPSPAMKKKIGDLRSKIKDMQDIAPGSAEVVAEPASPMHKMEVAFVAMTPRTKSRSMEAANLKVSQLVRDLQKEQTWSVAA
eukprot:TRINITY_DN4692_c0_g1_i2.p1 TRINITY_DN4692_c0_g1~~TRINITY_DN4692_c0_g1_i2.p1  ORF type:complete len:308 (+),score=103.93 TRINITY_DN4692_c0_g1_i2:129-1052(+)